MTLHSFVKNAVNLVAGTVGCKVVNANWGPNGFAEIFKRIKTRGIQVDSICDIGASDGIWTRECMQIFPDANYLLVDPLIENAAALEAFCKQNGRCKWWNGALGSFAGELTLLVDGDRTSVHPVVGDRPIEERKVRIQTLDDLYNDREYVAPDLIKLDVQGHELEVLKGAESTLHRSKLILIECSIQEVYKGIPLIAEVVSFLHAKDFRVFDIATYSQRPKDGLLAQADLVFARNDGSGRLFSPGWEA